MKVIPEMHRVTKLDIYAFMINFHQQEVSLRLRYGYFAFKHQRPDIKHFTSIMTLYQQLLNDVCQIHVEKLKLQNTMQVHLMNNLLHEYSNSLRYQ